MIGIRCATAIPAGFDGAARWRPGRTVDANVFGVAAAPIAQLAEAADLKSAQCRFESDWGHRGQTMFQVRLTAHDGEHEPQMPTPRIHTAHK